MFGVRNSIILKKKILFLCTGNSCRSQIAEGLAREAGWQAFSAGTQPETGVNPLVFQVMVEIGIDISKHQPKSVDEFLKEDFTLVSTVCDNARESCPIFSGKCEYIIHYGFIDPAIAAGNNEEKLEVFRNVRDKIGGWIKEISREYL